MNNELITSPQNPVFKQLKPLLTGRGIKKSQRALVSGEKLVGEALRLFPDRAEAWITGGAEGAVPPPEADLQHHRFTTELFQILDVFGTRSPLLVVRSPTPELWDPAQGLPPGRSILVPFQDPENVGSMIRSAVAFSVDHIILLKDSAHPFHPKAMRASAGAVLRAPLLKGPSLDSLPRDLPLIPLSGQGIDISGFQFPETAGLLPGLEGPGLPPEWRDRAVSIPIKNIESLNASVAAAIALHVWNQTLNKD